MHMCVPAAGLFEDADRRGLDIGIVDAHPEQHRPSLERGGELGAVPVGDDVVEQLLDGRAAEPGADQRGERDGDRAAGEQREAGNRQWRQEGDLVGEPGKHGGARLAAVARDLARDFERIMTGQHRDVRRREARAQQLRHGAVHRFLAGEGGDGFSRHLERRLVFGLGHGAVAPHPC